VDKKEIPKDRSGTPLSCGDIVDVFLKQNERPFLAKVICPGIVKSLIRKEGKREGEQVDNKDLEVMRSFD
jgi:hypothetical protein